MINSSIWKSRFCYWFTESTAVESKCAKYRGFPHDLVIRPSVEKAQRRPREGPWDFGLWARLCGTPALHVEAPVEILQAQEIFRTLKYIQIWVLYTPRGLGEGKWGKFKTPPQNKYNGMINKRGPPPAILTLDWRWHEGFRLPFQHSS